MPADKASAAHADEVWRASSPRSGDGVRYVDARSGALPEASAYGHLAGSRDSIRSSTPRHPDRAAQAVALVAT